MHLVIIGNGIAGVTCARYVRRRQPDARITVVSDESDHHWARTAAMYIYMGVLTYEQTKPYEDRFWAENRIALVRDRVERVDPAAKRLGLRDGAPLSYDALLIAAGSRPTYYDWPGQDLAGVQGLYGVGDLATMEGATMDGDDPIARAVVVGGGLIGVEMAEMLRTRGIGVTFLVRERSYLQRVLPEPEGRMAEREIRRHGVDLRMETELREILPDADGRARAVVTTGGEEVPCRFVGLATGVTPNVGFLDGSGIETARGVLVDRHFRTSAPGVYAAGDCAEFRDPLPGRRAVEQLWYTGRIHGATVAHTICGEPRAYAPGLFFNSAKFFDVEYQTYGRIDPEPPEGEATLHWEAPEGRRLLRLQYEAEGARRVVGFNLMGVRYRHAVCADWIRAGVGVEAVLTDLGAANFDPEFIAQCEGALVDAYNARHGAAVRLQTRRGWRRWMARLPMNGTTAHRVSDSFAHLP
ncbi:MAG: FAD-dependent oxidoreductase [Rubricoccaceae bacterium]|nr:FAD-dependent oxidoreductase [Rubricoccaceae bacterium]